MINLAIFASGSGTNAEQIMKTFEFDQEVQVVSVFTNKPKAGVIARAENYGVPVITFDKRHFESPAFGDRLESDRVDYVILAGFLWKIPDHLLTAYPNAIINIHPSLLPKYGGKGMYGQFVHQAVLDAGEDQSGITIHLVNEEYDEGKILYQESCPVFSEDSADSLANRIHKLEHEHFPRVVREYVLRTH